MNDSMDTDPVGGSHPTPHVVAYKLGGSLLDLPDLGKRVRNVIELRPESVALVIVGGGPSADIVRIWDQVHRLGDEAAHWLALRAMQLNERLLAALIPEATIVESRSQAREVWNANRIAVLSAFPFLNIEESQLSASADENPSTISMISHRLPHCWNVTSDSIAAWIALRWPATELILLKSTNAPGAWRDSSSGFVDPLFARLAGNTLKVTSLNLRNM